LGRGIPPTTLADAVRTARILDAAEASAHQGRFVAVASAQPIQTAGHDATPPRLLDELTTYRTSHASQQRPS